MSSVTIGGGGKIVDFVSVIIPPLLGTFFQRYTILSLMSTFRMVRGYFMKRDYPFLFPIKHEKATKRICKMENDFKTNMIFYFF